MYCSIKENYFKLRFTVIGLAISIILFSCNNNNKPLHPVFKTLDADETGITFNNKLVPTPEFNLFSYMYYYNGAGVGAGDFNNDGMIDLFFSANQQPNRIYINQGKMKFQDVSVQSEIPQDKSWSTGVSVIDINNDGMLDIYVCKVGHYKSLSGKNELLICQSIDKNGIPHYKDEAGLYGLDFSGFSTQAAFLDFDRDGDLDMFLLNHSVNHDGNYAPRANFINTFDSVAGQKLYRNDLITTFGKQQIHFTDITKESGINGSRIGYGLGVAVADINLDGWPDMYIGNDFHENDYLYINQKNGTFSDQSNNQLAHTSQFSMGVDVADVNNDAYPEIVSMDMLPYDPYMIRRSLAEDDYNIFQQKIAYGYSYQYSRNNLQLNKKNGKFSETGQYSGIYNTDWSWASLWMDFDNDGRKDLFVSNGIPKRMNDIDYINFIVNEELQQKLRENKLGEKDMSLINRFPEIKIPNQFFRNTGNLKFEELGNQVEDNPLTFSNGSAYADLDNDGDLDIIVNNINDPVVIYQNTANDKNQKKFTDIKLKGDSKNINAIGSTVVLFSGKEIRTYENYPVHGFQSSMLIPMHIGLDQTKVDSAFLIWPDNSFERINIKADSRVTYTYHSGLPVFNYSVISNFNPNTTNPFTDITETTGLVYQHTENRFNEFDREQLLPHMNSTFGPALAIADINHDGLEDVFAGASKSYHNKIFLQQPNGKFRESIQPELYKDSMWENNDAIWLDVNADSNPDLLIATGGNEYYGNDPHLLPLLYLNDGKDGFVKKQDAFTNINVTQSVIRSIDLNGDQYPDLFIGGRTTPWEYGKTPRSYLLLNDGTGKFTDVTNKYCKNLLNPGMVTDAEIIDMNRDGKKDLVLCYEWGGIEAFLRNGNEFKSTKICTETGWWNFIYPYDIDNDGDVDLIAGNLGLNTKLKASESQPIKIYYNDFDDNGRKEQLLTYYLGGNEIPFATIQELQRQMPPLKKKYLYAEDYAKTEFKDFMDKDKISKSSILSANCFENSVFINDGKANFTRKALPWLAQLSAYNDAIVINANNDDLPDFLLAGNYYDCNVELGRLDADYGTVLINKGKGEFECESLSHVIIDGVSRKILPININQQKAFIVARNNATFKVIKPDSETINKKQDSTTP